MTSRKIKNNQNYTDEDYAEIQFSLNNPNCDFLEDDIVDILGGPLEDFKNNFLDDEEKKTIEKKKEIVVLDKIKETQENFVYKETDANLTDILQKYNFLNENDKEMVFCLNKSPFDFVNSSKKFKVREKKEKIVNIDKNVNAILSKMGKCRYEFDHDEIEIKEKTKKIDKDFVCEDWDGFRGKEKNRPRIFKKSKK
ncbi:hypothetical protein GVAV_002244 [Gurleya vavrai]